MLHRDLTEVQGIHQIHSWEVADTAARNALSVSADDVGKIARQLDTGVFYVLSNHSPVTWVAMIATEPTQAIIIACGDESTAITAGAAKVKFRLPFAFTLEAVRASLNTAQVSGTVVTIDINEEGTSVLSTKLTIDNGAKTSTTATAAAVISDTALADDAEISIDVDAIGSGEAAGLKIALIGKRTA